MSLKTAPPLSSRGPPVTLTTGPESAQTVPPSSIRIAARMVFIAFFPAISQTSYSTVPLVFLADVLQNFFVGRERTDLQRGERFPARIQSSIVRSLEASKTISGSFCWRLSRYP